MLSRCYVSSLESKQSVRCAAPCNASTLGSGGAENVEGAAHHRVTAVAAVFSLHGLGQEMCFFSWDPHISGFPQGNVFGFDGASS